MIDVAWLYTLMMFVFVLCRFYVPNTAHHGFGRFRRVYAYSASPTGVIWACLILRNVGGPEFRKQLGVNNERALIIFNGGT